MENFSNDFATTLSGGMDAVTTAMAVVSATGSPNIQFRIRVDDEIMLVTAKAGLNWTVVRGQEGTTAALHLISTNVIHILTAGGLEAWNASRGWISDDDEVPATSELTVPAGKKMIVDGDLNVNGTMYLDGTVVIL